MWLISKLYYLQRVEELGGLNNGRRFRDMIQRVEFIVERDG